MTSALAKPWYREPWPWLLMAGPATVLVAGAVTTWIAFSTSDGLVAQDYYKQGMAVNKVLAKEDNAARLGLVAHIQFAGDLHRIAVNLAGSDPRELVLRFAHATRSGHDVALRLVRVGAGRYEAAVPQAMPAGRWNVHIEGPGAQWRLAGEWSGREISFSLGKTGARPR
jgi:hypothetical protein